MSDQVRRPDLSDGLLAESARQHGMQTIVQLIRVKGEVERQYKKWGEQNHDDLYWLGIATEELGEIAKEIIEHGSPEVEITQLAAVCVSWLEAIIRRNAEVSGV